MKFDASTFYGTPGSVVNLLLLQLFNVITYQTQNVVYIKKKWSGR